MNRLEIVWWALTDAVIKQSPKSGKECHQRQPIPNEPALKWRNADCEGDFNRINSIKKNVEMILFLTLTIFGPVGLKLSNARNDQ